MITAKQAKALANTPDEHTIEQLDREIREAAEQGLRRTEIAYHREDAGTVAEFLRTQGFTVVYNEYTLMLEVSWDD